MTLWRRHGAGCLGLVAMGCFVASWADFPRGVTVQASSKAMREQGAVLFHEKGCEHCHGVDGLGTDRGPRLTGVGRHMHKPEIERQIVHGGKEMPAFDTALNSDEVRELVAFLAAKKKKDAKQATMPGAAS